MVIKVLIENTETEGLFAEHGLCLYVEYRQKAYLIDSGASGLFAKNAEKLSVDLSRIDKAFLSHAHYDHAGGYAAFFERNQKAKVYLQQTARNRCYYKIAGPIRKYIGIPEGLLDQYGDRFEYLDGEAEIEEGIYLVPHSSPDILERARRTHMCALSDNKLSCDDFSHEQTLVFEEDGELICFNSCSHSGVDIALEEVQRAFPGKKIRAYIGGFHLMGVSGPASCAYSKEEVRALAAKLLAASGATFYSGHCTGRIAYEWLKEVLGDRLEALKPGKEIIL